MKSAILSQLKSSISAALDFTTQNKFFGRNLNFIVIASLICIPLAALTASLAFFIYEKTDLSGALLYANNSNDSFSRIFAHFHFSFMFLATIYYGVSLVKKTFIPTKLKDIFCDFSSATLKHIAIFVVIIVAMGLFVTEDLIIQLDHYSIARNHIAQALLSWAVLLCVEFKNLIVVFLGSLLCLSLFKVRLNFQNIKTHKTSLFTFSILYFILSAVIYTLNFYAEYYVFYLFDLVFSDSLLKNVLCFIVRSLCLALFIHTLSYCVAYPFSLLHKSDEQKTQNPEMK